MAPDETFNDDEQIAEALKAEADDETVAADGLTEEDDGDDLETQMATEVAAEGLEESASEDDLETQMATAMETEAENEEGEGDVDDLETQMTAALSGDDSDMMDALSDEGPDSSQKVRGVSFPHLTPSDEMSDRSSIDRLMDVDLNLSVELGRKDMQIKEILNLGPGKIIELDKLAGEPVDLLVNGKLLAKGEVVVVDENFGVRITELVDPVDRVKML